MLAAAATLAFAAQANGFRIEHAETRVVEGVYLLDAELGLNFSDESLEALESGVPLTVILELEIVEIRDLLWDKRVAELESRQQLRMHPLTGQYILKNLSSGATRSFRTFERAKAALGTVQALPMLDSHLLEGDQRYVLKLRARLDLEALPSPLKPFAYLSSLWRQSSEWSTWPIER